MDIIDDAALTHAQITWLIRNSKLLASKCDNTPPPPPPLHHTPGYAMTLHLPLQLAAAPRHSPSPDTNSSAPAAAKKHETSVSFGTGLGRSRGGKRRCMVGKGGGEARGLPPSRDHSHANELNQKQSCQLLSGFWPRPTANCQLATAGPSDKRRSTASS